MSVPHRSFACLTQTLIVFLLLAFAAPLSRSQVQTPPPGGKPKQGGQTIRVNVAMVQTDVQVFDKQGRFVPHLKLDQFELRIDGKVQPISFLELVSAGSPQDQAIWAKAESKTVPASQQPAATSSNPGRIVLIFLDDWHLADDSVMRSRAATSNLIKTSMGPKDRVAIFTASGQLGSVQQLTSDKAALLASLEKFNFQSAGVQDLQWPPMTEAQAVLIEQNDWDAITYFVQAITGKPVVKDSRGWTLPSDRFANLGRDCEDAERVTRRRAADLAHTSAAIGERSLSAIRNLIRSAEALSGRKLLFLLSDGFVLQPQRSDIISRIGELTTAAARAGVVIYTLDARGLVVGLPDAKTRRAGDMTGALAHSGVNEVTSPQDALNALAADTGGRFLKNTNALDAALITTLREISRYYLLGWYVDPEKLPPGKYSTIRVAVKDRSDLSVRVRQGSLDLSRLVSEKPSVPAVPPERTPVPVYPSARTVVDMSVEELLRTYPEELRDLTFEENSERLDLLLKKVGEGVETFFRDFPNTVSKEAVRLERSDLSRSVKRTVTQNFNYAFFPDRDGRFWKEARLDSKDRQIENNEITGFPFFTSGYAGLCMFFHPRHQFGSQFRYLGKQRSSPNAELIAFAQQPESNDVLGSYQTVTMLAPVPLLYQGLVWVNPSNYQIVRMRTDLLAPGIGIDLTRQTSEIWFSEVRFQSVPQSFWLPREVVVTSESYGWLYRNIHRYSDYRVFTVETQEKIEPPKIKK